MNYSTTISSPYRNMIIFWLTFGSGLSVRSEAKINIRIIHVGMHIAMVFSNISCLARNWLKCTISHRLLYSSLKSAGVMTTSFIAQLQNGRTQCTSWGHASVH